MFDPPYLRREKPQVDAEAAERFGGIAAFIDGFERSMGDMDDQCPSVRKSWEYLRLHGQLCRLLAKALNYKARGMREEAVTICRDIESWARVHDKNTADALDFYRFTDTLRNVIKGDEPTLT